MQANFQHYFLPAASIISMPVQYFQRCIDAAFHKEHCINVLPEQPLRNPHHNYCLGKVMEKAIVACASPCIMTAPRMEHEEACFFALNKECVCISLLFIVLFSFLYFLGLVFNIHSV